LLASTAAFAALAPIASCSPPVSPTATTAPQAAVAPTTAAAPPAPATPTTAATATATVAPTAAPQPTAQPSPTAAPSPTTAVSPTAAAKPMVMLSSTIGPIDAGIISALEDAFTKKSGIAVRHVGAGTGATLDQAKNGQFDIVIVHARALEDKFVADGFGVDRRDIMYNDFVILGPAADPAKIKGEKSASEAFKKIAAAKVMFVTRGDNSGTNVKELEIWQKAGIKPSGDWYYTYEKGATGNGPTTKFADEKQAYTLMDRATIITMRKDLKLQVLMERDQDLLNFIAVIRVNPAKFPKVNAEGAKAFADWLVADEAQTLIKSFGVAQYGEPLFVPNSDEWKKKNPN
jgi:tungstate transport system substrate-binding protein